MFSTRYATSILSMPLIWLIVGFLPVQAGGDGLGRWYPPGAGRQIGKYNWPYSYHTSAVPQRPGHGYFPTYWRDWHENAHVIFSEPEHTVMPKREKRKAPKPEKEQEAETLPEPNELPGEEAPPPPMELPPEESPEMPSENLELPSGATPEAPSEPEPKSDATTPETPPAAPSETTPSEPATPEPSTELPMPTTPSQPLPQTPDAGETPQEPASPPDASAAPEDSTPEQNEGPSLYRPQKRERSLAQHASATSAVKKKPTESEALRALGAGFNSPTVLLPVDPQPSRPVRSAKDKAPTRDGARASANSPAVIRAGAVLPIAPKRSGANGSAPAAGVQQASHFEPVSALGDTEPARAARASAVSLKLVERSEEPPAERGNPLRDSSRTAASDGWKAAKNPLR